MVETITPAVHGGSRDRTWRTAAIAHTLGSVLGGAATGGLVGGLGWALTRLGQGMWFGLAFLTVVLLAGVRDMLVPSRRLPALQRQVPESWRRTFPYPLVMFAYGFQLGLGWATHAYYASYHVLLALIVFVVGNPILGAAPHGLYGLARAGLVVLVAPGGNVERTDSRLSWLACHAAHVRWGSALASLLIGVFYAGQVF